MSDGTINVVITDELDDETDPSNEQVNAINYLIETPEIVKHALLAALDKEYPKLKDIYGFNEGEDDEEFFPSIEKLEDYRKVFGVGSVFILRPSKEGYAYVGLECGCTWDEEHGLGFLMHKDKVIKIGGADEAFSC